MLINFLFFDCHPVLQLLFLLSMINAAISLHLLFSLVFVAERQPITRYHVSPKILAFPTLVFLLFALRVLSSSVTENDMFSV